MRGLVVLLLIAAAIAGAAFLADHPGTVAIVWGDWQIDTSVGVLIGVAIAAGLVIWVVLRTLIGLVRLPRVWRLRLARRRRRRGERAVAAGLIAVAAGDPGGAARHARSAARLLPEAPLSLLLSAQAAQLGDDRPLARRLYTAMLDRPALNLVGLRGLLAQAVESGDDSAALTLAQRARELQPDSPSLARSLLALEARTGDWDGAAATLDAAATRKLIASDRVRHQRGVILHELSLAAERAGDTRRAMSLAAKAQVLAPDLPAPAAHYARLLLAAGRRSAALKAIERGWRTTPNPELARIWADVHTDEAPLGRLRAFERLAASNPQSPDSHMAAAEAALDAQLWGEARRHLGLTAAAMPDGPTRRLCLLMARLEESEYGTGPGARDWFDRAASAPPGRRWLCSECGAEAREWQPLCPACGGFDTLQWRANGAAAPHFAPPRANVPAPIETPAAAPKP